MLIRDFTDKKALSEIEAINVAEHLQQRFVYYRSVLMFMLDNWGGLDKTAIEQTVNAFWQNVDLTKITTRQHLQEKLYSLLAIAEKFTGVNVKTLSKYIQLADNLYNWDQGLFRSVTTISISPDAKYVYKQIDEPCDNTLTEDQVGEFLSIYSANKPKWFLEHPLFAQNYLLKKCQAFAGQAITSEVAADFNLFFKTIPASWRRIPGLANNLHHTFEVIDNTTMESVVRFETNSSSTPSPINIKDEATKTRLTKQNIDQYLASVKTGHPVLMQSLLSSTRLVDPIIEVVKGDNSTKFVQSFEAALAEEKKEDRAIIYSNHPLNGFRKVPILLVNKVDKNLLAAKEIFNLLPDDFKGLGLDSVMLNDFKQKFIPGTSLFDAKRACDTTIASLNEELSDPSLLRLSKDRIDQLRNTSLLLSCVKQYIELNAGSNYNKVSDDENLFRSALELIMLDKMGSQGTTSCKSGKDRAGVVKLWADAILAYFVEFKEVPGVYDRTNNPEKRRQFVDIFVRFFMFNHYGVIAAQNFPYAEGIKEIGGILPSDVLASIKNTSPEVLSAHSVLASFNSLKPISSKNSIEEVQHAFLSVSAGSAKVVSGAGTAGIISGLNGKVAKHKPSSLKNSAVSSKLPKVNKSYDSSGKANADIAVSNEKQSNIIEVSSVKYAKDQRLYILKGNLKLIDEVLRDVAENKGVTIKITKENDLTIYNLFDGQNRLTKAERVSFLSEVCLVLQNNQREIIFDTKQKPEVKQLKESFARQANAPEVNTRQP